MWLYWSQSVMLGLFNFLDILTVRTPKMETYMVNGDPSTTKPVGKSASAFFFLFHYGFFHFVYFFFLISMKKTGPMQWDFYKNFLIVFFCGQLINFIQHKIQQSKQVTSLSSMFFIPYLRIIPMHLTILLPNFIPVSGMGIFLVLKSLADVGMYLITKPPATSKEAQTAMMATEQGINI
jgi:hypothetical protein